MSALLTAGGRAPADREALRAAAAKVAAQHGITPPAAPPVYKRKLPSGAKKHTVDGVGVFATQSVGSTAYSCGYHVYFHAAGAEESATGSLAFKLSMNDDGTLVWVLQPLREWGGPSVIYTPNIQREAQIVVDGLKHLDEVDYMFQVHGCIEPLIVEHIRELRRQKDTIQQMIDLLADERQPSEIFVEKEQSPTGKGFFRPRDPLNPADCAEYDERRLRWRMSRQRAEDKLERLTTGPALLRYEMLLRMKAAWSRWSAQRPNLGLPKAKRPPPPLVTYTLVDLLENARHPGGSVVDEINDAED